MFLTQTGYNCALLLMCAYVSMWVLAVGRGSAHTHMAGGRDIPAQAPQDLIPPVSRRAVASGHAVQAQKYPFRLR